MVTATFGSLLLVHLTPNQPHTPWSLICITIFGTLASWMSVPFDEEAKQDERDEPEP